MRIRFYNVFKIGPKIEYYEMTNINALCLQFPTRRVLCYSITVHSITVYSHFHGRRSPYASDARSRDPLLLHFIWKITRRTRAHNSLQTIPPIQYSPPESQLHSSGVLPHIPSSIHWPSIQDPRICPE